jgi:hypothetical protein
MLKHEKRIYSQNGEDGIIAEIFRRIGTTNKFFVEFGVRDGTECNTRLLRTQGWQGVCMDGGFQNENVHQVFLTAENINDSFKSFGVPKEFDLLSIDVDGNDFWIWKAVSYSPRCVVIEYNSHLPPDKPLTIPYDPGFRWSRRPHDDFFGASLQAMIELGKMKGYEYVCVNEALNNGYVNAFFVTSKYMCLFSDVGIKVPTEVFRRFRHNKDKFAKLIDPFASAEEKTLTPPAGKSNL